MAERADEEWRAFHLPSQVPTSFSRMAYICVAKEMCVLFYREQGIFGFAAYAHVHVNVRCPVVCMVWLHDSRLDLGTVVTVTRGGCRGGFETSRSR